MTTHPDIFGENYIVDGKKACDYLRKALQTIVESSTSKVEIEFAKRVLSRYGVDTTTDTNLFCDAFEAALVAFEKEVNAHSERENEIRAIILSENSAAFYALIYVITGDTSHL